MISIIASVVRICRASEETGAPRSYHGELTIVTPYFLRAGFGRHSGLDCETGGCDRCTCPLRSTLSTSNSSLRGVVVVPELTDVPPFVRVSDSGAI